MDKTLIIYIVSAVITIANLVIFWGMASNISLIRKELKQIKEELRIQSIKNEKNIHPSDMVQMENVAEVNSYNRRY